MYKALNTIKIAIISNIKSLKLSLLNYIMLVIVFPFTYLIIAMTASEGNLAVSIQVSGIVMSILFSLFVNMQASLIANSNNITIRETYAVYNIKPVFVFIGQCAFHMLLAVPIIVAGGIVIFLNTNMFSIGTFAGGFVLTFALLSTLSMLLGLLLKNPNIAGPIINVTYMIIITTTPMYYSGEVISGLYLLNPLTHVMNLFRAAFGMTPFCSIILSVAVTIILTIISFGIVQRILKMRTGNEKQNII